MSSRAIAKQINLADQPSSKVLNAYLLKIVCSLFPFAVCLFKLHLNHSAFLTPDPPHLRYRTVMGIFGIVAGFFLTYRAN